MYITTVIFIVSTPENAEVPIRWSSKQGDHTAELSRLAKF